MTTWPTSRSLLSRDEITTLITSAGTGRRSGPDRRNRPVLWRVEIVQPCTEHH